MVHRRKIAPPKDIAYERMHRLFELAVAIRPDKPELASKYLRLAERIGRRMDLSVPRDIKRFYCKKCGLPYGDDTRIRIKKGLCIATCGHCSDIRRIPYRKDNVQE